MGGRSGQVQLPATITMEDVMTSVALTIFSGIIIFIVSQIVLEFWIRPIAKLNNARSELSAVMLSYVAKVMNATLTDEAIIEINKAQTQYLSVAWSAPISQRKKEKLRHVAMNLNYLKTSHIGPKKGLFKKILEASTEIEKLDNKLIIRYAGGE